MAPHVCSIAVVPAIIGATANELRSEGRVVCTCCDKDHGTLNDVAHRIVFKHLFSTRPELVEQFKKMLDESPNGQAVLNIKWPCRQNRIVRFRDNDYAITDIIIRVHAVSATAPLHCQNYELLSSEGEGRTFSHLQGTAGGKTFDLVIPHVEGGHAERIVLKIDSAKSE
jgi:hypothetical protein